MRVKNKPLAGPKAGNVEAHVGTDDVDMNEPATMASAGQKPGRQEGTGRIENVLDRHSGQAMSSDCGESPFRHNGVDANHEVVHWRWRRLLG